MKNPGGRPTKYKAAYCEEVIAAGELGLSLTAFAGMIGVARSSINEWMEHHPEFRAACAVHQAKRTLYLERGLLSPTGFPGFVTSRIFALKNADPEGWKDKHDVEHSGSYSVIQVPAPKTVLDE